MLKLKILIKSLATKLKMASRLILAFFKSIIRVILGAIFAFLSYIGVDFKNGIVYRLFWGRGNLYKKVLHLTLVILTVGVIATGISTRIAGSTANSDSIDINQDVIIGDTDLLQQGGNIETVLALNPKNRFKITKYTVEDNENLEAVAKKFGVTQETIRDSNNTEIDYYDPKVEKGDELYIPEISGVLYKTKGGDTLGWIMTQVEGGNVDEVLEINGIRDKDKDTGGDQRILIPNAKRIAPPKPVVAPVYANYYIPGSISSGQTATQALAGIRFIDPLGDPACSGYVWNRGFTGPFNWGLHDGVDLGRNGGCPIGSVADGTVIFSGTENYGGALAVTIDHGNGVHSVYYHMSVLWVRAGQRLAAGEKIGYMGCTGFCFGTHLHLSLRVNYVFIDPAPYVPYNRPY